MPISTTLSSLTILSLLAISTHCLVPAQPSLQFYYKSHMIPHPEKAYRGGQDAFFNSSRLLVVADGVGGWNQQGVDPSKYSRFLCQAAGQYVEEDPEKYTTQPLEVLKRAQSENDNIGSATMVVVSLDNNNLRYCYLGDSGLMVIRKYEKLISIFEFVEQQHRFNFPFQLAMEKYGGDRAQESICGAIEVRDGDIVVVGSDGLFDNVAFHEVLVEVTKAERQGALLTKLAQKLAEMAIQRGSNPKFNSPFAQRAKQQNLNYLGGKLDDTTVIIAKIGKTGDTYQL